MKPNTHEMSDVTRTLCRERLRHFLRQYYGNNAAKKLAQEYETSHRTTERWLTGECWPEQRVWFAMLRRWGRGFNDFVMSPAYQADTQLLDDELLALRARYDRTSHIDSEEVSKDSHTDSRLASRPRRLVAGNENEAGKEVEGLKRAAE